MTRFLCRMPQIPTLLGVGTGTHGTGFQGNGIDAPGIADRESLFFASLSDQVNIL